MLADSVREHTSVGAKPLVCHVGMVVFFVNAVFFICFHHSSCSTA